MGEYAADIGGRTLQLAQNLPDFGDSTYAYAF